MCADSSPAAKYIKDPPLLSVVVHPFNMTNPYEFLTGKSAEIHELGQYGINMQPVRKSVDFSESNGTVSFNVYNEYSQSKKKSCNNCKFEDTIYVMNTVYLTSFAASQHEGLLMLTLTCSAAQIGLISNPGTNRYCKTTEMNTATVCVCCSRVPTVNATLCGNIMSPLSRAGGQLSWLAKYDNGTKRKHVEDHPKYNLYLSLFICLLAFRYKIEFLNDDSFSLVHWYIYLASPSDLDH
jgi:hypothetical protein